MRLAFLVAGAALLWAPPAILGAPQEKPVAFNGVIVTTKGERICFEYLGSSYGPRDYGLDVKVNGATSWYWLHEIGSLVQVDNAPVRWEIVGKTGVVARPESLRVGPINSGGGWVGDFNYVWLDPVTGGRRAASIKVADIALLEVGTQSGRLRWNPATKQLWPPYYLYDPYDGTRLTWTDAVSGPAPPPTVRACPRCYTCTGAAEATCRTCGGPVLPAVTNIGEVGLDAFLRRAGVDPASREAAAAKRYAKAWLNPFATSEEIDAALREVVQGLGR